MPDPYLFGGSERQVRRTQKRFVTVLKDSGPVLDIGCGRGIFMRLLRDVGTSVAGIDSYSTAVRSCRDQGLDVECADALAYLPSHRGQFGGIFCSHVIEHLTFEDAQRLIFECASALKPGGRLVVVTPNPGDIGVVGNTFWLDPTHMRPYPVLLLRSMISQTDLTTVRSGVFHGALPKRDLPRYMVYRALLGQYYGKPNGFVVAAKPL